VPSFYPNRFTSGGGIAERVNTVKTRHKQHAALASDFKIRAHSSAPDLSDMLIRRLLVAPQDVTVTFSLPASPHTAAAISKNSSQ